MRLRSWAIGLLAFVVFIVPSMASARKAEYVYALAETTLQRWSDAPEPTTVKVESGERLEVVYRLGNLVRVRAIRQRAFGWLPADKVSTENPQSESAPGMPPRGRPGPPNPAKK